MASVAGPGRVSHTNDRLVSSATEETIIARVGEGIVSTIGSAEVMSCWPGFHLKTVLEGLRCRQRLKILY